MGHKPDNPQAYPIYSPDMNLGDTAGPGMTLRDYFAGQALVSAGFVSDRGLHAQYAAIAYAIADAMLAEREK